jgi:hypothetical protein
MTTLTEAPPAKGNDTGGHKYGLTRDGLVVPAHEVVGKNGKVRNCTIREIRKCSYDNPVVAVNGENRVEVVRIVPSVTTIFQIMDKPGLSKWKNQQVIAAVESTPRFVDESDDAYYERIMDVSSRKTGAASELGTRIHRAIEVYVAEADDGIDADIAPHVHAAVNEASCVNAVCDSAERIFLSEKMGYAGTADWVGHDKENFPVILDFKSRTSLRPYETDALQLAAYGVAIHGSKFIECGWAANIVVSTTEPGTAKTFKYETLDMIRAFEAFKALFDVYKYVNGIK